MATDPAVQAARLVYDAWSSSQDETRNFDTMVAVMTTVLPLIRAQAFTEAAAVILSIPNEWTSRDCRSVFSQTQSAASRLVRGLGEETASVDSKINKA